MSRGLGMGGHQRPYQGFSHDWYTPPEILRELGPFDYDPCTPTGDTEPWKGHIWLNPPYGPYTGRWLDKLATHGDGIALVFARTETQWFRRHIWYEATALLFLYGRLHFYRNGKRAKHNSGAPSVLVAYGNEMADR